LTDAGATAMDRLVSLDIGDLTAAARFHPEAFRAV
jgi:hypothetical protein